MRVEIPISHGSVRGHGRIRGSAVLAELWAALRFTTTLGPVFGVLGLFVLASLLTMAAGCLQVQLALSLIHISRVFAARAARRCGVHVPLIVR